MRPALVVHVCNWTPGGLLVRKQVPRTGRGMILGKARHLFAFEGRPAPLRGGLFKEGKRAGYAAVEPWNKNGNYVCSEDKISADWVAWLVLSGVWQML